MKYWQTCNYKKRFSCHLSDKEASSLLLYLLLPVTGMWFGDWIMATRHIFIIFSLSFMYQQFCKFQLHPKYSFLFQLNHFILCVKNKNIIHIAMFPIRILMLKTTHV